MDLIKERCDITQTVGKDEKLEIIVTGVGTNLWQSDIERIMPNIRWVTDCAVALDLLSSLDCGFPEDTRFSYYP